MSPARRRQAVVMLMDRLSISERRACRAIGQPRSTQRRPVPAPGVEEEHLRERLRSLARAHPRYGYRRMTAILCREGFCVNHKRIQRLCRDEGLRVLKGAKKRSRVGISTINGTRLRATHPNHVWAIDYQFDQTTNFKTLKLLNITDEFTKEALAIDVRRSITADDTVAVLESIVAQRGTAPSSYGWTTALSSLPTRSGTGVASQLRAPPTSSREAPGRTRSSSPSTANCETSCSTSKPSIRSSKRECSPRTSGSSTTPIGPTRRSVSSRQTSSRAVVDQPARTHLSSGLVIGGR